MNIRMKALLVALSMVVAVPAWIFGQDAARRQWYSEWKYDDQRDRYTAIYWFRPSPYAEPQQQWIIYYPQEERNGWVYYYNPTGRRYWGRAACQHHADYRPDQMQWSYLGEADRWGRLTVDCPVIPGSDSGPEIAPPPPPPDIDETPPPPPPPG